jgi:hypothetical protein
MTTPGGSGTSIPDLTSGLKALGDSGPADLKLSTDAKNAYLKIIGTFRTSLQTYQNQIKGMGGLGSPGNLGSAIETKNNLDLDVNGLQGIETALGQYLDYLDQFETTVKDAANRLIQSG